MRVIIKKDTFDTKNIRFKNNKKGIKLLYNIIDIYMVGIPLKIEYEKIIIKDYIILLTLNEKQISMIREIDNLFMKSIKNYISFIHDNKYIKIKKHDDLILNDKNNILVTINCIKPYKDNNYVQIYTI